MLLTSSPCRICGAPVPDGTGRVHCYECRLDEEVTYARSRRFIRANTERRMSIPHDHPDSVANEILGPVDEPDPN